MRALAAHSPSPRGPLVADAAACALSILLERYRQALCTACVNPQCTQATIEAWCDAFSLRRDDLSVKTAAMHGRVVEWLPTSWTTTWLCGEPVTGDAAQAAVFRHSCALLDAADFGLEAVSDRPGFRRIRCMLCPFFGHVAGVCPWLCRVFLVTGLHCGRRLAACGSSGCSRHATSSSACRTFVLPLIWML